MYTQVISDRERWRLRHANALVHINRQVEVNALATPQLAELVVMETKLMIWLCF